MKFLRKANGPILAFIPIIALLSGCAGQPGASVTAASVDSSGHLMLALSNGSTLDAGYVVGATGATGATRALPVLPVPPGLRDPPGLPGRLDLPVRAELLHR